jgi:uncharacterized iron-regulated membrane protein
MPMKLTSLWNLSNQPEAPTLRLAGMRRTWLNIHLWIGLGLALLLIPISLSGALLVWHDHVDAIINPDRYTVTAGPAQPASVLLAGASAALGRGFEPVVVRMPEGAGWPATVMAREQRRGESSGRPRLVTVYLDPPTARVLATAEFRNSLIGFLHRFHENLTIPEYSGRAVVGWVGVGMLVLSLSGIYLWWPRNAGFLRGLRWRRGPATSFNLHHLFGFWIAIPLAVVSATGIYLGFPQQARELLASVAPMTPQQRGGLNAALLTSPRIDVDRAVEIATGGMPGSRAAAVFLPTQQSQVWRIQLRDPDSETLSTVTVDDRNGALTRVVPQSGDTIAQWIRWIHEGSHSGVLWQILVFLCGILPAVFAVTGTMIWLRSRKAKSVQRSIASAPQLDAAE